jgi:hypothetical protein
MATFDVESGAEARAFVGNSRVGDARLELPSVDASRERGGGRGHETGGRAADAAH